MGPRFPSAITTILVRDEPSCLEVGSQKLGKCSVMNSITTWPCSCNLSSPGRVGKDRNQNEACALLWVRSLASLGFARQLYSTRQPVLKGLAAGRGGLGWVRLASVLPIFAHF